MMVAVNCKRDTGRCRGYHCDGSGLDDYIDRGRDRQDNPAACEAMET